MAMKKGGLGRGLDALFADNAVEENSAASAVKLSLNDIEPNKDQPRKTFDEEALAELAESIAQHGIIQPLLVRPMPDGSYQLVAGERRWRAARRAGLSEVPVVIREMSDSEMMELALIENLQREDLNPIEEAEGLQQLINTCGLTQETAAARVGRSRPAVANALRLLTLPAQVLALTRDGKLSAGHARALLPLTDEAKMLEIADLILKKGISVRETERLVKTASKEKKAPEKAAPRRDTFYDEVELALTNSLGRRIKVNVNQKENRGTIEIEFFDQQDLSDISKLLDPDNL
ncbi:MAG TPA: ParB/RepB/Spo0J family partition protein [Candidatus Fimivicinus intestinavium]|nr:ParB/RepB/Spo0J family partition protein [Candidatus Fimivicinus intestinavium]